MKIVLGFDELCKLVINVRDLYLDLVNLGREVLHLGLQGNSGLMDLFEWMDGITESFDKGSEGIKDVLHPGMALLELYNLLLELDEISSP